MINLLHVAEGFLQIYSVPVASCKCIGELLSEYTNLLLCVDSEGSLVLVLVPQHHVFLSSDWLLVFNNEGSQNHKLFF